MFVLAQSIESTVKSQPRAEKRAEMKEPPPSKAAAWMLSLR